MMGMNIEDGGTLAYGWAFVTIAECKGEPAPFEESRTDWAPTAVSQIKCESESLESQKGPP